MGRGGSDRFGGGGGVTDHGALSGTADDDHTQYLLVDGTRAMTGALNMAAQNITSTASDTPTYALGRALIDARFASGAVFSNRAHTGTASYGVLHDSAGNLYLNAVSTRSIFLTVNNASPLVTLTATLLALASGVGLKFGTHTTLGAETVSGYITITDAGGASRKLAVVS